MTKLKSQKYAQVLAAEQKVPWWRADFRKVLQIDKNVWTKTDFGLDFRRLQTNASFKGKDDEDMFE